MLHTGPGVDGADPSSLIFLGGGVSAKTMNETREVNRQLQCSLKLIRNAAETRRV